MTRKNPAAVALGRLKSPAKRQASKANARLGGRKPKFQVGDRAKANEQAPADYRDRFGTVTEIGPKKNEYRIEFSDGERPEFGYLMSWWLDLKEKKSIRTKEPPIMETRSVVRRHSNGMIASITYVPVLKRFIAGAAKEGVAHGLSEAATFSKAQIIADSEAACPRPCQCPPWPSFD